MLLSSFGQHYIRVMNRKFSFDDRPLRVVLRFAFVLLEQIYALYNDAILLPENLKYLTLLSFVVTSNYDNLFSLFYILGHNLQDLRGQ